MPLYEYRCVKCHAHLEKIRKYSDPPLTKCEKCGGKLEQLLSSPAFKFKGTGWYINDYAKKTSPSESEKSDGASSTKSEVVPGTKTDKTPAKEASKSSENAPTTKSIESKPRSRK